MTKDGGGWQRAVARFDREQRQIAKLQKKLARRQAKRLAMREAVDKSSLAN